ncbi:MULTISPECIES: helix-turn-helix domain-containing protein [unclassified Moraxella]|uniref:helix-turn-helix domain-containing protein n=1 Tax=unclassified Moraxella TaxID=2685852 RepID=UPI002B411F67|nr:MULTISPECIES: helix-turn-helix domain-containing protein [unclassified Moraxella]
MTTYITLQEKMAMLDDKRREQIEARANHTLLAIRLAELRKNAKLSQKELAEKIGISQSAISQLESSGNVQLDTLNKYVTALGGKLRLSVEMPNGQVHL